MDEKERKQRGRRIKEMNNLPSALIVRFRTRSDLFPTRIIALLAPTSSLSCLRTSTAMSKLCLSVMEYTTRNPSRDRFSTFSWNIYCYYTPHYCSSVTVFSSSHLFYFPYYFDWWMGCCLLYCLRRLMRLCIWTWLTATVYIFSSMFRSDVREGKGRRTSELV